MFNLLKINKLKYAIKTIILNKLKNDFFVNNF